MLGAMSRVVAALRKDVLIVGCFDQYPFSLAAALLGLHEIMLKLKDDRPFVEPLMARREEYSLAYGRALAAAGADLLSDSDSPAGLIGPQAYHEVALPFGRRVIPGLKAATAKPVSLHICGHATPMLADMAASGADVLEIDHKVDLACACRIVEPNIALWGNVDPVGVLAQGSVSLDQQITPETVAAVKSTGHRRIVLSSGGTLAVETPLENLDAMLRAVSTL